MKNILQTALLAACSLTLSSPANSQSPAPIHLVDRPYMAAPDAIPIPASTTPPAQPPLVSGPQPVPAPLQTWKAQMEDRTIRGVITRWARDNGWQFSTHHWTLTSDLPIVAPSVFTGDFREAIRQLLSSTELTDLPAQPCFYTNQVVRVVPRSELCDRTANRQNAFTANTPAPQVSGQ